MSTSSDEERSLINHAEFLEELGRFEPQRVQAVSSSSEARPRYDDAYDALESGLTMDAGAQGASQPGHETDHPFAEHAPPPAAPERRISLGAAVLVIVACLTAGGAIAAFVFGDRLAPVTATQPASR